MVGVAKSVITSDQVFIKAPTKLYDSFLDFYNIRYHVIHPQILGVFNNLSQKLHSLELFRTKKGIALQNLSKDLSILDYKNIYNKDKLKLEPLLKMGKLLRKSFEILPITADFESFDSQSPERAIYFIFHSMFDEALRKYAFHIVKDFP